MHYIQTYILDQLIHFAERRNRDLRPPNVESNLFQYHLKQLVKEGLVSKINGKYRLGTAGLVWADQFSQSLKGTRPQPKVITTIALTNNHGAYILLPKPRQPFIGKLFIHAGKVHRGEEIIASAKREVREKLHVEASDIQPKGIVHLRIYNENILISDVISFMFTGTVSAGYPSEAVCIDTPDPGELSLMQGTYEMLQHIEKGAEISEINISC